MPHSAPLHRHRPSLSRTTGPSISVSCRQPPTAMATIMERAARWIIDAADSPASATSSKRNGDAAAAATTTATRPARLPLLALSLVFLFALLLRYGVSGGSYSGAGGPASGSPLHGDFEAQRHWMEVTLHLPLSEWYTGAHPANDLQYWGLDYPPLTAYVSAAFGWAARDLFGLQQLVALGSSRGHESDEGKLFMRLTVLLCDALLCMPAIILALRAINAAPASAAASASPVDNDARTLVVVYLALIHPAMILIDHGHFQYNCFSLGLVALAVYFLWRGRDYATSVSFVLSLAFKQMSLYYAPAFFFYLLARTRVGVGSGPGRTVSWGTSFRRLAALGCVVLGSMLLLFLPFLLPDLLPSSSASSTASSASPPPAERFALVRQVFHRMFPFARGLYEDKVANFWCASSILVKWTLRFERTAMVRAALAATLLAMAPSCALVYARPSRRGFLYALAGCSMSFFLFSFQVHEKSVLLPLLPVTLLAGLHPLLNAWMGIIATFSMYPLLKKDGHALNYFALQLFFGVQAMAFARAQLLAHTASSGAAASTGSAGGKAVAPPAVVDDGLADNFAASVVRRVNAHPLLAYRTVQASLVGVALIHVLMGALPVHPRYPDLSSMMVVVYAAAHFILFHIALVINHWAMATTSAEDQQLRSAGNQGKSKEQ